MRIVTRQQNIDNTRVRIDNKIGIRGISQDKRNKLYCCDFIHRKQRFYFKPWKMLEEAVYNRKMAEEYFGIETLSRNPLAAKYINELSDYQKEDIRQYTYDKISQKETV